ncbi:MAG: hypothetical protein K0R53_1082 [Burkholderiales bacterium]|nr:hypothetical protein [Burkholderiales bacterium]
MQLSAMRLSLRRGRSSKGMQMTARTCGNCSLCCKLIAVREFNKAPGVWCAHARPGCKIYGKPERPASCGIFQCAWLERDPATTPNKLSLPDFLRPDRCHVVLTGLVGGAGIAAHVDPAYPIAWREGPIGQLLQDAVNDGVKVLVVVGQKRHAFNTTLDELDRLATQENRVPARPIA